ncbi:NADP-dependent oxidoreductase [Oligoflexus tunisiensis]|uniref:NADP-dependent oxidoreductase n=1 Tax=Oligoflexus tunisiensis TaxID=708132 RepID=UPI000B28F364|nr:NADP-dependent oxidoreductase [Oligoflexus tunisiensis]
MKNREHRQIILKKRPLGRIHPNHFQMIDGPRPVPRDGEALVQVMWLGIDPTQRTWLNEKRTYMPPVAIGEVMRGSGVGIVVDSRSDRYKVGDWVAGMTGWQNFAIAGEGGLFGMNPIPDGIDPKAMLSILGVNGLTAYFGMTEIGKPKSGETVFVSGAAGSVGSIAGQIAKIRGCKVIGSAGGPEKCSWVTQTANFDACIDYKSGHLEDELRRLAPDGIHVVFDNVGGTTLEAALANLANHARIVISGSISSGYSQDNYGTGPRNYMELGFKRARMEGFIFLDYLSEFPRAFFDIKKWIDTNQITYAEDIKLGLESAPDALQGLFDGKNFGKQLIKLV